MRFSNNNSNNSGNTNPRAQRPPAPTAASSLPAEGRAAPSPVANRVSSSPVGGLSHPEDLSERAAQLAARARELRNTVEIDNADTLDNDNFQHAKLQNMYLASMETALEKMEKMT